MAGKCSWWLSHTQHLQRTPSRLLWLKGREGSKSSGRTGLLIEILEVRQEVPGLRPGHRGPERCLSWRKDGRKGRFRKRNMMAGFGMGWKRTREEAKPPQGRDCPTNQGETGTG